MPAQGIFHVILHSVLTFRRVARIATETQYLQSIRNKAPSLNLHLLSVRTKIFSGSVILTPLRGTNSVLKRTSISRQARISDTLMFSYQVEVTGKLH